MADISKKRGIVLFVLAIFITAILSTVCVAIKSGDVTYNEKQAQNCKNAAGNLELKPYTETKTEDPIKKDKFDRKASDSKCKEHSACEAYAVERDKWNTGIVDLSKNDLAWGCASPSFMWKAGKEYQDSAHDGVWHNEEQKNGNKNENDAVCVRNKMKNNFGKDIICADDLDWYLCNEPGYKINASGQRYFCDESGAWKEHPCPDCFTDFCAGELIEDGVSVNVRCEKGTETLCNDGINNDGDDEGADCKDPDCSPLLYPYCDPDLKNNPDADPTPKDNDYYPFGDYNKMVCENKDDDTFDMYDGEYLEDLAEETPPNACCGDDDVYANLCKGENVFDCSTLTESECTYYASDGCHYENPCEDDLETCYGECDFDFSECTDTEDECNNEKSWCQGSCTGFYYTCELNNPDKSCKGEMTVNCNLKSFDEDDCKKFGCTWSPPENVANKGDAGYINPSSKQKLCSYEENKETQEDEWRWWDSTYNSGEGGAFVIHTIDLVDKTYDVVSNVDQWYECQATGDTTPGFSVGERGTLPKPSSDFGDGIDTGSGGVDDNVPGRGAFGADVDFPEIDNVEESVKKIPERTDDDGDGDGYSAIDGVDCDDTDPNVHPNAPDPCGGDDDDCDPDHCDTPVGQTTDKFTKAKRFMCYKEAENSAWAECCGYSIEYCTNDAPKGRRQGNVLTTVNEFPCADADSKNCIMRYGLTHNYGGDYYSLPINELEDQFDGKLTDWTAFESFEFYIYYTTSFVQELIIYDSYNEEGNYRAENFREIFKGNIIDYSVNTPRLRKWLHIVIPIPEAGADLTQTDWTAHPTDVQVIVLGADRGDAESAAGGVTVAATINQERGEYNYWNVIGLDRLFLRPKEEANMRYCSANPKISGVNEPLTSFWIDDLDETRGVLFGSSTADVEAGLYPCQGTPGYGWTGNMCCGDDFLGGENYTDINGACWKNNFITENFPFTEITYTVNEITYKHFCNQESCYYPLPGGAETYNVNYLSNETYALYFDGGSEVRTYIQNGTGATTTDPNTQLKAEYVSKQAIFAEEKVWGCDATTEEKTALEIGFGNDFTNIEEEDICIVKGTYFCSPTHSWISSTDINYDPLYEDGAELQEFNISQTPWMEDGHNQECCANSGCWNGTVCVEDYTIQNDNTDENAWVCHANEWAGPFDATNFDWDWNHNLDSFCFDETECFCPTSLTGCTELDNHGMVEKECVSEERFYYDHLCLNGSWTTQTALVAATLLNITKKEGAGNNYSLYCNDPDETVLLERKIIRPGEGRYDSFNPNYFNDVCVLKYTVGDNTNIVIGTSMGSEIQDESDLSGQNSLLRTFDLMPDCTAGLEEENKFIKCDLDGKGEMYYNNKTKIVIYSEDDIPSLEEPGFWKLFFEFLRKPFKTIIDLVRPKIDTGIETPQNFDQLYIAESGVENKRTIKSVVRTQGDKAETTVSFEKVGLDICQDAFSFDMAFQLNSIYEYPKEYVACMAQIMGADWAHYLHFKEGPIFKRFHGKTADIGNEYDVWKDLGPSLRLRDTGPATIPKMIMLTADNYTVITGQTVTMSLKSAGMESLGQEADYEFYCYEEQETPISLTSNTDIDLSQECTYAEEGEKTAILKASWVISGEESIIEDSIRIAVAEKSDDDDAGLIG